MQVILSLSGGNKTLDYFFIHFLMKFSWKLWNLRFNNFENNFCTARMMALTFTAAPKISYLRQEMLTYFRSIVILKVLGNTSHFKNLHERHVVYISLRTVPPTPCWARKLRRRHMNWGIIATSLSSCYWKDIYIIQ